jgi:signal peptidase I
MTTNSFLSRFQQPLKQWIKAFIWSVVYILFIVWVGNFWWLLLLPFIVDTFITKYIPWTWWKKSKNKTFVSVMGWVDAIVFALVAVYFINTYIFQNYQIPSSSLEKSLLVGDFLFVSKASYGPRVPNTPLSFPLVQHTFPIINTKSFIDKPQWDYKRLKGFDEIERNDIVVFNFPAGDTVCLLQQNPDYYTLCYYYGKDVVHSRKDLFGDIVYRPVDRRENYVKRCVAIAGDWMQIKDNQLYINGQKQERFPGVQFNYFVQTDGTQLTDKILDEVGISKDDRVLMNNADMIDELKAMQLNTELPVYHFPLDEEMYNKMKAVPGVVKLLIEPSWRGGEVFPLGAKTKWNRDNYGPLWIPKRGVALKLNMYNLPIYERAIRVYEHNTLEVKDGKFYINGVETEYYTFKMDYYWMMGDNRHNSADSRFWGFVPEDHVVGRPVLVWLSLDKDKGLFDGKIRFNRFFKNAER